MKAINESLAPLTAQDLLESMSSGALVIHTQTRQLLFANPTFYSTFGYGPETLETLNYLELVTLPPKTDCALCQDKKEADKTAAVQSATGKDQKPAASLVYHGGFLLTASGEKIKVKIKHSPLTPETVLCTIDPFSEDVTLTQAHSDFVSTVSHEFRTPLTSIKGFADTLLRYGAQLPADQQKRFITIIKDQADRLTRLVENLLTVSKLGASRMEMSYRSVSVQRTVEKVIQNVSAKAGHDKQSISKHYSDRPYKVEIPQNLAEIWVDPDKFEQIMINLVDNAVKYSYPGTEVKVTANLLPSDSDQVQIKVVDKGVGIPAEHLPRIFTKFSRIDNPLTREVEGTGLGLYITQSLTKAMGGDISVDSIANEGTTFTLSFPIATAERQAAHRRKMDASDSDNRQEED